MSFVGYILRASCWIRWGGMCFKGILAFYFSCHGMVVLVLVGFHSRVDVGINNPTIFSSFLPITSCVVVIYGTIMVGLEFYYFGIVGARE